MLIKTRIGQYRLPTDNPASDLTLIYEVLELVNGNASDLKRYLQAKVQVGKEEDKFWEGTTSKTSGDVEGVCSDRAAGVRSKMHNHFGVAYIIRYSQDFRNKELVTIDQLINEYSEDSNDLYDRVTSDPYTEVVRTVDVEVEEGEVSFIQIEGVDCVGYKLKGTDLYVYYPSLQQSYSEITNEPPVGEGEYDFETIYSVRRVF